MGLLKNIFGRDPVKTEQKGDSFVGNSDWGRAKIEYEKALVLLDKKAPDYHGSDARIQDKLQESKESLALEHKQNGEELIELGDYDDARELFGLAIELSEDRSLISDLETLMHETEDQDKREYQIDIQEHVVSEDPDFDDGDDYFDAICGTLPDDVRKAYLSYGDFFKNGYIALNKGDFELAEDCLTRAMDERPEPDTYIPLELASVYMNLEKYDDAIQLLEIFLEHHPDALPGYQLFCEIFWELNAFDKAEELLDGCPEELKSSSMYYLLYGATKFKAEKYSEAVSLYEDFLEKYGWFEPISRALARTYEKLERPEKALEIYGGIMSKCSSCHTRIDPVVKRKFVDLSFELGQRSSAILEMYLALAQEDPMNTPYYFQRVSQLYTSQGNDHEALRFKSFAEQAENEKF